MDISERCPLPAALVRDIHKVHLLYSRLCGADRPCCVMLRLDQDLATFLESQPEIRDLSLRGIPAYTSDPFTIPPSALPHLESFRSVHVDPDTLGEVSALVHSLSTQIDSCGPGNSNAPSTRHLAFPIFGARLSRARSSRANFDARPAPNDPHRRCVGAE